VDFEWYFPNSELLKVSISDTSITFYNETVEAMGSPKYILLGFNEDNKVIGVKACDTEEENSLAFSLKQKNSYIRINDIKFIRFIKSRLGEGYIEKSKQQKYSAKWDKDKGILYIFLDKPLS
jgi:hypothetical protein